MKYIYTTIMLVALLLPAEAISVSISLFSDSDHFTDNLAMFGDVGRVQGQYTLDNDSITSTFLWYPVSTEVYPEFTGGTPYYHNYPVFPQYTNFPQYAGDYEPQKPSFLQ